MRNLKKLLALVLTLTLVCSFVIPVFAKSISDFPDGAAAEDVLAKYGKLSGSYEYATKMLIDLGVLTGGDGNLLNLDGKFTRAQFVVMLYQCMNSGERIAAVEPNWQVRYSVGRFNDTKGHWAEGEIAWAAANGFVVGVGDGNFAPYREITFNNGVMLIMNALGYDAIKEGIQNLNGTWVVDYENARDVYLRDFLREGVASNLVALDVDTMQLSRAEAFYLFWRFLSVTPFDYDETYGSLYQARYRAGNNMLWNSFQAITDTFTVVSDGAYFGLPEIPNWVGPPQSVGTDKNFVGNDGGAQVVIQRPSAWDRANGNVTEWQNFILAPAEAAALEIGLDDIGRKLSLTFQDPAVSWEENYTQFFGEYNRHAIRQIYGDVTWLSTVEQVDTVPSGIAVGNTWDSPSTSRTFIDYNNDLTTRSSGTAARFRSDAPSLVDIELYNRFRNSNTGDMHMLQVAGKAIPNAFIRVVKTNGNVDFVFIEYYVVSQIDNNNDGKINFYNNKKEPDGTNKGNALLIGHDTDAWKFGERAGLNSVGSHTAGFAKNDYLAVSRLNGHNGWANWMGAEFLLQRVNDKITGDVTSVRYDADLYNPDLKNWGTGNGTLTMDGKTYTMSSSTLSRIKSFNTLDNRATRTFIMFGGEIVDVVRDGVANTYCVIEAAGIRMANEYNDQSVRYFADIILGDGTVRRNLEIERIYTYNNTIASAVRSGAIASGQYGANKDPKNGDPLFYYGTDSAIFSGSATAMKGHIFRYTLNGDKVTLYEVKALEGNTAAVDGRIEGTSNSRFNTTWGTVLGTIPGMTSTTGRIMLSGSEIIVQTTVNSNPRYSKYSTAVPGFNVSANIRTEALVGDQWGGIGDNGKDGTAGAYVRFAYIDASTAVSAQTRTYWAVALDTGYDNWAEVGTTGSISALISGGAATLKTIAYDTQGYNTLKELRRGDVFTYESEDSSPDRIHNIHRVRADALVQGLDGSGYFGVQRVKADDSGFEALASLERWGTIGNNYILKGGADAGPITTSALRDAIEDKVYNLYVFDANTTRNYSNSTETVVVRVDINTTANANVRYMATNIPSNLGDRRDIDGRIADAKAEIEAMLVNKVSGSLTEPQVKTAVFNQIKAIADYYGVTMDAFTVDDIDIINYAGFAAGAAMADIPPITLKYQEADADDTDALLKNIPLTTGEDMAKAILPKAAPLAGTKTGTYNVTRSAVVTDEGVTTTVSGTVTGITAGSEYDGVRNSLFSNQIAAYDLIIESFNIRQILNSVGIGTASPYVLKQINPGLQDLYDNDLDGNIFFDGTDYYKTRTYINSADAEDESDGTFYFAMISNSIVIFEIYDTGATMTNEGQGGAALDSPAVITGDLLYTLVFDGTTLTISS